MRSKTWAAKLINVNKYTREYYLITQKINPVSIKIYESTDFVKDPVFIDAVILVNGARRKHFLGYINGITSGHRNSTESFEKKAYDWLFKI